jgi:hypothetical protein
MFQKVFSFIFYIYSYNTISLTFKTLEIVVSENPSFADNVFKVVLKE